jgi:hypothetical protein
VNQHPVAPPEEEKKEKPENLSFNPLRSVPICEKALKYYKNYMLKEAILEFNRILELPYIEDYEKVCADIAAHN